MHCSGRRRRRWHCTPTCTAATCSATATTGSRSTRRGVRGDPHLDIWPLTCAQVPPLPEADAAGELRRRIDIYARAAGLDPERAAAWVRVIACAEAVLTANGAFEGWSKRLRQIAAASP